MKYIMAAIFIFSGFTYADSWTFPKKITTEKFKFGNTTIIRKIDARKNQLSPEWSIEIRQKRKLVALYKGISFDHIYPIHDDKVFVGISNLGLPDTALVIFDNKGRIRLLRDHNPDYFEYCNWSATIRREWYDQENPELKYETIDGEEGLYINSCTGKRINALEKV